MPELNLMPIEGDLVPHQPGRACRCRPVFAIEIRGRDLQDDLRVFMHRNPGDDHTQEALELRFRKGVVVKAEP